MPLIFLDTPQIDVLETARRTDPDGYRSFLDTWKRLRCTLVFTLTQGRELRRYSDASRRRGRYQVLIDLEPIRCDVPLQSESVEPRTLIHREIVRAVVNRDLRTENGPSLDRLIEWTDVLPGHLDGDEAGLLSLIENEPFPEIFNLEYDAARFSAAADRDSQNQARKRVRDLPNTPLTPEKVSEYKAEMERAFALMQEQSRLGKLPSFPVHLLSWVSNLSQGFFDRSREVGPQAALLEFLPIVDSAEGKRANLTRDELVSLYCFQLQVRFVARDLLKASDNEEKLLVKTLEFAECPGSWLEWMLRLRVRYGSREPRPNHQFDAERLAYLPYVDLLITDREMTEFVRQIRKGKSAPAQILDAQPPVRCAPEPARDRAPSRHIVIRKAASGPAPSGPRLSSVRKGAGLV